MKNNAATLLLLIVAGVIIADMVANPKGTSSLFSGFKKIFQIFIDPTNTKGL